MFIRDHNKTAFIYDNNEYSYRAIIESINLYARHLPFKKGDRVVLYCENSPQWIYAFFSLWHLGAIVIPMDFSAEGTDFSDIIKDAEPAAILTSGQTIEAVQKQVYLSKLNTIPIFNLEDIKSQPSSNKKSREEHTTDDDIAIIMYTSGTTGNAKGVMLSYGNLKASIESLNKLNMLTDKDSLIALLPFHHIFPLQGSVIAPLISGASIVFIKNLVADDILDTLQKYPVTMFLGVPRLYEIFYNSIITKINKNPMARIVLTIARIVNSQKFGAILFKKVHKAFGGKVHSYLTGGARMDSAMAKDLWSMGFRLVEGYGATETAPLIAFNPVKKIKLGSVGKPMSGTEVMIKDGEIAVKGPNVMMGYYKRPEDTAKVIKDGWFYTGDLGAFDKDGYLTISGRKDEMIILPNGKNIHPEEIENSILQISPLVKEIGVMQQNGQLVAYILPDFDILRSENIINIMETIKWKVIDKYNRTVSGYKRILDIKLVKDEFPKTRLGKLRRFMLKDTTLMDFESIPSEELFSQEEFDILSEFFSKRNKLNIKFTDHIEIDLGLDSLDKVELQTYVESVFGISLKEENFSSYATVGSLSLYISKMKTRIESSSIAWKNILNEEVYFKINEKPFKISFLRWLARKIIPSYFHLDVSGQEHIPDSQVIIAPNHQSYLDIPLLTALLPKSVFENIYFMVKDSKFMSKVVSLATGNRNIIVVNIDKDLKGALQKSAAALRAGKSLIIFPEGIRTRNGSMEPFKKTFAILSKEFNIPILPVAITGAYDAFAFGNFLPTRGKIGCKFFKTQEPGSRTYDEITTQIERTIKTEVARDRGKN